MISSITENAHLNKLVISTGNILTVNNKLGSKSNEELEDGLKLTLASNETNNQVQFDKAVGQVLRATQELNEKLTENERPEISIGAKIFLNKNCNDCIKQAVTTMLTVLNVEHVDNLVLAYHPHPSTDTVTTPSTPQANSEGGSVFKWNNREQEGVKQLKQLWSTLEEFALKKQINQLGVSDLDAETLTELYSAARKPPSIAQVNISKCCKVPQSLQEFCTQHDIQLLTHSDPEVLVPEGSFIIPGYKVDWTLRYQVHLKCRGVLTAKGYILGATRKTKEVATD